VLLLLRKRITVSAIEASTIALALEKPGCTLILDDYKARRLAEQLAVQLTGNFRLFIGGIRQFTDIVA